MPDILELHGPQRASDRNPIWIANGSYEIEPPPASASTAVIQARVMFMEDERDHPSPHRARTIRANFGTRDIKLQLFQGAPAATVASEPVKDDQHVYAVSRLVLSPRDASRNDRLLIQHGEISLDAIRHPLALEEFLGSMLPGFSAFSEVVLNADGVGFVAMVALPWSKAPLHARFQVRAPFDAATASQPALQVILDRRKPAPRNADGTPGDAAETLASVTRVFDLLRTALATFDGASPQWAELVISDEAIPGFFWDIAWAAGKAQSTFAFNQGSVKLILADAPPDASSARQRRIVTVHPIVRFEESGGLLALRVAAGKQESGAEPSLRYGWLAGQETITLSKLTAGYNALTLARDVRTAHGIARPGETPVQRVLWAAMPLSDGWMQWPVYNLVEEHYKDQLPPSDAKPLIAGAAVFTNQPAEGAAPTDEHPWSLIVLDAAGVNGAWALGPRDGKWLTVSVDVSLREPELTLDGLLWLAKSPPTLRDALPDLEDFVGTLASVSLSTDQSPFRFACPLRLDCEITITARSAAGTGPTARLDNLKINVGHDPRARLKESWFEGANAAAFLAPLIWRRHPSLPFIQSLPLTQTQDPPAHPCASRELAPFDLPWRLPAPSSLPVIDPSVWSFERRASGAADWLSVSARSAAAEWLETKRPVLPLASLSLPGLALQPGAAAELPGENGLGLRVQYEFGLPYLDQLNAFAQLPKDEDDDYRGGLFSGTQHTAPEDKQRRPLGRRDFKAWWGELSTKRFLARTEAADAIINRNADADSPAFAVRGLVEPLDWPITPPKADFASYPGRLQLSNADNSAALVLEGTSALRGFDGYFGVAEGELVRRPARQDGDFHIIAGSMRAWQPAANGMIRDQRGLSRGCTTQGTHYLDTPIAMDGQQWTIRDWLQAVPLMIGDTTPWQLFLTGVALKNGTQFKRKDVLSDQHEDVNDPAAQGRTLNPLTGYKWWLGPIDPAEKPMRLCGLDMQPLGLEDVKFDGDKLTVTVLARLTAPLPLLPAVTPEKPLTVEQTQRANAVHLTFTGTAGAPLVLSGVETAVETGVWTLTADEDGPLVTWRTVQLVASKSLQFGDVRLSFAHFGEPWSVKLGDLTLDGSDTVVAEAELDQGTAEIKVKRVKLKLDLRATPAASRQHRIEMDLGFHWGDADGLSIETVATYEVWPAHGDVALDAIKVLPRAGAEGLAFSSPGGSAEQPAAALGLQAVFSLKDDVDSSAWSLLPGAQLDGTAKKKKETRGFLAMSFAAAQAQPVHDSADLIPSLRMTAAAAEVLLPCRWGASLQDSKSNQPIEPAAVFGSSSGDLYANCALLGAVPKGGGAASWERRTLLNGWLEVKNLISWPNSLGGPGASGTDSPLSGLKRWALLFKTAEQTPEDPAAAIKVYEEVAKLLAEHGGHVRIEGHADDDGPVNENYELSSRRAAEIRKQLQPFIKGITPKPRVSVVPYGEQRLKVISTDENAKQQNRRVEIVLTPSGVVIPQRDGSADGWRHFRHTVRVLFNQHELDSTGYSAGSGKVLFGLKDKSCQFLAATEHQIADVSLGSEGGQPELVLHRRWRWSVIQEVRLVRPADFSQFLASTAADHHGLQPDKEGWSEGVKIGAAFQAYHRAAWLKHLKLGQPSDQVALLGDEALVVEASVPLWLKGPDARSERKPTMTTLQFLPNAVQRAELATPEDIGLVDPGEPPWLTLGLPFVGRMQPPANDIVTAPKSIMMVDPVLWLSRNLPQSPPALCALACRSEDSAIVVRVNEFDAPQASRWDRLSEGSLEEAWFRIQRPPLEEAAASAFAPLLASAPQDSPGRLSRRAALTNAFRAPRSGVPPKESVGPQDPLLHLGEMVWREASWFGVQMIGDLPKSSPQGFFLAGYLLRDIWDASRPEVAEHVLTSATLVPVTPPQAQESYNQPVGLAISPYRCLGSTRIDTPPEDRSVVLTLAEVLATVTADDGGDALLKPVAQGMWPGDPGEDKIRLWAIELLSQLAPESPIAVIRLRRTAQSTVARTQVAVDYGYLLATPTVLAPVDPPPLPLRSPVEDIHFAEGQYGGNVAPTLLPFEIAPPQVAGIQPIYSEDLPSEIRPADRQRLSALRLAIRNLAETSRAVVGRRIDPEDNATARLWWQAVSSRVAYDTALQSRKLMPTGFRSPARAAWLAAPARSIGPAFKTLPLAPEPPAPDSKAPPRILQWQPVMPHAVDVVMSGSRAGAPMALRVLTATETPGNGQLTPSASIVVEQRMPRPVSLPPNRQNEVERAHRPWAALWSAEKNCLDKPECLTDVAIYDLTSVRIRADDGSVTPSPRRFGLLLRLSDAAPGQLSLLAASQLPTLHFDAEYLLKQDGTGTWTALAKDDPTHTPETLGLSAFFVGEGIRRKVDFKVSKSWSELRLGEDDVLNAWVARQPHGAAASIEIKVPPKTGLDAPASAIEGFVGGYFQTLRFPLRVRRPGIACAPLQPRVVHFEDPAYNRQLTSTPAQRSGRLFGDDAGTTIVNATVASDRREYNPDSELLLVLARKDVAGGTFEARLSLRRQDRDGNKTELAAFDPLDALIGTVADRVVTTLKLSDLRLDRDKADNAKPKVVLQPDDLLYIVVHRKRTEKDEETVIELPVKIVSKPVLPPPSEGYALLREMKSGAATAVHTPRFAWSPQPSRVELINPDDLLGAAVRRRAVFRWSDSPRWSDPETSRYRVQKLSGSGATHWPLLD
jgi:hypothetical protein